jgi:23S rRNA pseudouridine2605 synthase
MAAERLQKLLARAGFGSRRAAESLVLEGRVSVNGVVVTELGAKADPARDDVRLDGERIRDERPVHLALHKPTGVVTTLADPQGRPTIRTLLPADAGRVHPVGRLDFASSGLLLLTNDGELSAALLHPRSGVPRTYLVKVGGRPGSGTLARLRRGVKLDDGVTGPAEVEIDEQLPTKTWLRITIREGKRREIRRMFETLGHTVDKLMRISFGPIEIGRLRPGTWRPLSTAEVESLRRAAGLATPAPAPRAEAPRRAARAAAKSAPRRTRDACERSKTRPRGSRRPG